MKIANISCRVFVLSEIQENCYVLSGKGRDDCVVVDPGIDPAEVVDTIEREEKNLSAILVTHGHYDHISGIPAFKAKWRDSKIYIGEKDRSKLNDPLANLSFGFGTPFKTSERAFGVYDGDVIDSAGFTFKVIEIPGHSCGHIVYLLETEERPVLFCGDVIFANGIGRTDFQDGDFATLRRNIREKIFTLPDETLLCSGHGPLTTVATEKRNGLVR